jgi:RND family efflux transporter MFP subunit
VLLFYGNFSNKYHSDIQQSKDFKYFLKYFYFLSIFQPVDQPGLQTPGGVMTLTPNEQDRSLSALRYCQMFLLLTLLVFVSGCTKEEAVEKAEPVKPVKIITVQAGNGNLKISLPGRVRAAPGPLVELPIQEGQVIKKGDLVAQILLRDFQTAVNEAKARELQAEQQYRRYKELYAQKQVSKADFDRYRAARDVARAQSEDARNALKDTTLTAPFTGVIARRYVENFEKVQAKQAIAFLQFIDKLEILVDVAELIMATLRNEENAKITATFDAVAGITYPLQIKEFSTDADPATNTYQVVFLMDQPSEANILPGMTANVLVLTENSTASDMDIPLPAIAVLQDADQKNFVWVLNSETMTAEKKAVKIGQLVGSENIIVEEGLQTGDQVIITGITKLREGMKVRPWENKREGR